MKVTVKGINKSGKLPEFKLPKQPKPPKISFGLAGVKHRSVRGKK